MKNRKNNKGFSLVELIVVVAIMAVLVGVLTPQYMKYIERSRLQKDNSAIAEMANAIKIAMANEEINAAVNSDTEIAWDFEANKAMEFVFVNPTNGNEANSASDLLRQEVADTVGTYTTVSNAYKKFGGWFGFQIHKSDSGAVTINIKGYIKAPGATATTNYTTDTVTY